MPQIGGYDSDTIVTKWVLDPSGYTSEINKAYREQRKAENQQKKLNYLVQKAEERMGKAAVATNKLSKSTRSVTMSMKGLGKSMLGAVTGGNLLAGAISKTIGVLGELITQSGEYAQVASNYTGNIEASRKATQGLVSDLDIMKSRNQMNLLGVKLSEDEYNKLLKSLVKVSSAMGTDLKYSLESATTAMARQSKMMADNIGVVLSVEDANKKYAASVGKTVQQLTEQEKKLAFQREFLDQITNKTKNLTERTKTLSDYMKKGFTDAINKVTKALAIMNALLGRALRRIQDFFKGTSKFTRGADKVAASDPNAHSKLISAIQSHEYTPPSAERRAALLAQIDGKPVATKAAGVSRGRGTRGAAVVSPKFAIEREQQLAAVNAYLKKLEIQKKNMRFLAEERRLEAESNAELQRKIDNLNEVKEKYRVDREEKAKNIAYQESWRGAINNFAEDMGNFSKGALASFSSGILMAAQASIESGASFKQAMVQMVKSTLWGIAQMAAVKSVFALAEAFANWWNGVGFAAEMKASALYASAAVLAGAGAAGMSAATRGSSGNTGIRSGSYTTMSSGSSFSPGPKYRNQRQEKQEIKVNLYIGDAGDPSAKLFLAKQLETQLAGAA